MIPAKLTIDSYKGVDEVRIQLPSIRKDFNFRKNCEIRQNALRKNLESVKKAMHIDGTKYRIWVTLESRMNVASVTERPILERPLYANKEYAELYFGENIED